MQVKCEGYESQQLHTDDSDYTLSICLGHHCTGGDLVFHSSRMSKEKSRRTSKSKSKRFNDAKTLAVQHHLGHAILYPGLSAIPQFLLISLYVFV
jgi:hypothetical protein